MTSKFVKPPKAEDRELFPKGRLVLHESFRNGEPSGKHHDHLVEVLSAEEIKEGDKIRHFYELFDPQTNSTFKCEHVPPRHKLSMMTGSKEKVPPRTLPAYRAIRAMNLAGHKWKSVIIQTENEIVIQVRGDYDHLIKRLRKMFKSKGKDESGGVMRIHAWKLRGLGLMNVYQNEANDFMSVRFLNNPELGVRRPKEEEVPPEVVAVPTGSDNKPVEMIDNLESIDMTG